MMLYIVIANCIRSVFLPVYIDYIYDYRFVSFWLLNSLLVDIIALSICFYWSVSCHYTFHYIQMKLSGSKISPLIFFWATPFFWHSVLIWAISLTKYSSLLGYNILHVNIASKIYCNVNVCWIVSYIYGIWGSAYHLKFGRFVLFDLKIHEKGK